MVIKEEVSLPKQGVCSRCQFVSSQKVCKACVLLEGLNKGLPRLGVGKSSKAKKMLEEYNNKQANNAQKNGLQKAVDELNDEVSGNKDSCLSRKGRCVTGLCTQTPLPDSGDKSRMCDNEKSCSKSNSNDSTASKEVKSDSKINRLLKEYAVEQSESAKSVETKSSIDNYDDENEDVSLNDDSDDGCGDSCGRLGSLHIGF